MKATYGKSMLKQLCCVILVLAIVSGCSGIFSKVNTSSLFSYAQAAESVSEAPPVLKSAPEVVLEDDTVLYLRSFFRKILNRYFEGFGLKSMISATGIDIDKTKLSFPAGTTMKIDADVIPPNAENKKVRFESDNPRVATVNMFGRITGHKPGTATVYAVTEDGGFYKKCRVTVTEGKIYCESVSLPAAGITLEPGFFEMFDVTVFPINTTDPEILIVSDLSVVDVAFSDRKLVVTALSPGTSIVTVKCGNYHDTLYVNVTDPDNPACGISHGDVEIFGGSSDSNIGTVFRSMASFADGGYIACGTTASINGDFEHLYTDSCNWKAPFSYLARFSPSGAVEWIKLFGDSSASVSLYDIDILSDGSIVAAGTYDTPSTSLQQGSIDGVIYRLSSNGGLLSKKFLKGSGDDFIYSIAATSDGYVVGGKTNSSNGSFSSIPGMSSFVMNYDMNNTLLWMRYFNASKSSHIADIDVDSDNNIFLACTTTATDGNFSEFDGLFGSYADTIVLKYNYSGSLLWYHVLATSGTDLFESIAADGNGGCYIAGNYTLVSAVNPDGTLEGIHNCGSTDALVFRLDQNGNRLWCKILSGFYNDFITDIVCTDNGVGVTGYSASSNREFSSVGNMGGTDGFVCFYDAQGNGISLTTQAGSKDDAGLCIAYSSASGEIFVAGKTSSSNGSFAANPYGSTAGYVGRYEVS